VNKLRLNIGCGHSKLEGYVNIDIDPVLKTPDLVLDVSRGVLPYATNTVDEIVMSHTLEHIPRMFHNHIFNEINRVLRKDGSLFVSFPDFKICSEYLLTNKFGQRDEWEKAIFGRGLTTYDCHRCALIADEFAMFLIECGFKNVRVSREVDQFHHSMIYAEKAYTLTERSDLIAKEISA